MNRKTKEKIKMLSEHPIIMEAVKAFLKLLIEPELFMRNIPSKLQSSIL